MCIVKVRLLVHKKRLLKSCWFGNVAWKLNLKFLILATALCFHPTGFNYVDSPITMHAMWILFQIFKDGWFSKSMARRNEGHLQCIFSLPSLLHISRLSFSFKLLTCLQMATWARYTTWIYAPLEIALLLILYIQQNSLTYSLLEQRYY